MKIENILRITGGVLRNTPAVNSIEQIRISSKKISQKDLFIDINNCQEDINEALQSGAYCILTSGSPKISDEEVAWIYVENLQLALLKLSRFFASSKNHTFVELSPIQYELTKCLHLDAKVIALSQNTSDALIEIINSPQKSMFFVIENQHIAKIDPELTPIAKKLIPQKIVEKSIFYSSVVLKKRFISELRLTSLFIPDLCALLDYLDTSNITYKIDSFNNFEHFYPQFVDNKLNTKNFGTTQKALIFEKEKELFQKEILFLEKKINFNSLLIFIPKNTSFTCKARKIVYNSAKDIKKLQTMEFRYALIYGCIHNFREYLDENKPVQMALF